MNNYREINTPFFSNKADEILRSVLGQLSDGLWENSRIYAKYWVNFSVERRANGQVYFAVNKKCYEVFGEDYYANPFEYMSDAQFLNWVAAKLKAVIVAELKDNSIPSRVGWKRNNTTFESEYLSYTHDEKITVADIYVVYDWLKGRKIDMSSAVAKDVFGNVRSKDQVKMIEIKQSEIDFIQANAENLIEDIKEIYAASITNIEKQLASLKDEMNAKCKEINHDAYLKVKALREELEKISA